LCHSQEGRARVSFDSRHLGALGVDCTVRVETLETVDSTDVLDVDLCLVGGGPAAITIARELADQPIRILIVESGGRATEAEADALSEIESVGAPRSMDQSMVRNRVLGGTSSTWSGRCALLDPIDFEPRPWVPLSGWPIGKNAILPHVERACLYLGIAPFQSDAGMWSRLGLARPEPDVDETLLRPFFWQYSRDRHDVLDAMRFGPAFMEDAPKNVRVLLHATVTHVDTTQDGTAVTGVEIADRRGRRLRATAPLVVLCAGGIENPRLLLASNSVVQAGLGNARGLVGRYLMDHPRCRLAAFDIASADPVRDRYGVFKMPGTGGFVVQGLTLSPDVQRDEGLLNCAAWLSQHPAADDPWEAIKRLRRPGLEGRKLADVTAALGRPGLILRGARRRLLQQRGLLYKLDGLDLDAMVEQVPDADSRITLGERRDRFDMPLPRVDWRIGETERRSIARLGGLIVSEWRRLGLPAPQLADWVVEGRLDRADFFDPAHPMGATRMADDPSRGVVDASGEVHGVRGLHVAGASIFPTAGHANPTFMIVAMAVRLAERLKQNLHSAALMQCAVETAALVEA